MCKHEVLTYLGEQETLYGGATLSLYNCKQCKSTIVAEHLHTKQQPVTRHSILHYIHDFLKGSFLYPLFHS